MESLTRLGLWPFPSSCPQVSVHVSPVDGLCLAGGGGLAQQVLVPAYSARPVGFSVVPTAAAAVSLKVVARGSLEFPVGDAVSKVLKIEVNGVPRKPDPPGSQIYALTPGTLSAGQARGPIPNPTPWSADRFYSPDPALSLKPTRQVLGSLRGEGQLRSGAVSVQSPVSPETEGRSQPHGRVSLCTQSPG